MSVNDLMRPTILITVALILSFGLTGLATWYANRRGLLDHPGERHSHTVATPRGGGMGLVLALVITSLWFFQDVEGIWTRAVLPGIVVLAILGWWDDHASLSARFRFFIQLLVSIYLLWCTVTFGWEGRALELACAGLFLVWMTNLYNFMDGSNGMAGSQGVFAGIVLAVLFGLAGETGLALAAAMLAACCLGFLPWNLGQARVFMGDTGSLALGFGLGALLVYGVVLRAFELPVALLVMLVFLTDSTLTLLMRVKRGERWYNPHKQHLYQRLIERGWAHGRVLFFYQAINLMLVLPGIVVAVSHPALAWIVAVGIIMAFIAGWYLITRKIGVLARAG